MYPRASGHLKNEAVFEPPDLEREGVVLATQASGLVEGKTCIVTGGAGSIGLAAARTLLAEGAKVMLVDLDADKLKRTVRELATDKAAFVAAKHALMGLMRCVAREVAARRIRVNSVNPGPVDNVFMRTAEKTMSQLLGRDAGEWFDEQIPLGRHARPEEIAQAVCFLASDRSSYTSGTALMVDGAFCA